MNVLGLDCSADSLCAAVRRSGASAAKSGVPQAPLPGARGHETRDGTVILEIDAGLRHAQRILPAVDLCLKEAGLAVGDLDLLACAAGPGSFTGLRIALATVKGLSSALGIPFVTVPTPDCLAAEWEGASPW
ncbi:MAG: tRNA (adenosine(37)-N6)-threonylcarbamoyltransferase complex dimerization subunit type 1 TsaB [Chromatiales bacterium]|nr:tRNA (adenosine(37)-N6)-threonylcarbamoyltransferase complex dimerization subunit type 1 TsaB [Chromatiales bacterium]